jgi:hypothetical protein
LSPIQLAATRWMPGEPARESTNVRSSGAARRRPSVVAVAMSSAYSLWWRACEAVPRAKRIASDGIVPVAGSFMSFQIPATPDATWRALRSPHQRRASSVTKSGNAVSPGQTWPR